MTQNNCRKGCPYHKWHCSKCDNAVTYSPANGASRPQDIPNPCEKCFPPVVPVVTTTEVNQDNVHGSRKLMNPRIREIFMASDSYRELEELFEQELQEAYQRGYQDSLHMAFEVSDEIEKEKESLLTSARLEGKREAVEEMREILNTNRMHYPEHETGTTYTLLFLEDYESLLPNQAKKDE